jgi:hypothetical protein
MNLVVSWETACPYCFEPVTLAIDTSQGAHETIEDCQVCCRPIRCVIECVPGEVFDVLSSPG